LKATLDTLKTINEKSTILSKKFEEHQKKIDGQEYNDETKQEFAVKMILKRKIQDLYVQKVQTEQMME
jgi:hypothetical protein